MRSHVLKTLEDLRAQRSAAYNDLSGIPAAAESEARSLTADEQSNADALVTKVTDLDAAIATHEARVSELDAIEARTAAAVKASPTFMRRADSDPFDLSEFRNGSADLTDSDARARARTAVEQSRMFASDDHRETVTKLIDGRTKLGAAVARMALTTGSDDYVSGWAKLMVGRDRALTERERIALDRGYETWTSEDRAGMTSGTGSSGGYAVPIFVDPTLVITGAGSMNPFRAVSTVKQIGPAFGGWYGVTGAQVSASWTAEASAAPDNTPTLTQPNIPVYMAELFIPASFQAFEDIADLAGDVLALFADARDNLEATAHATGDGSAKPTGIVTAVTAITASRVSPATGGAYALADAFTVHSALPARFRRNPASLAWAANIAVHDKSRQLAMAQNSGNSVWTDSYQGLPSQFLGDKVLEASEMSSSLTTGQNVMMYGDFSKYYIVDRVGFSVEFIPNLFDTSTGRPTAQRGWLAHWRTGANAVDTNAFRVLKL